MVSVKTHKRKGMHLLFLTEVEEMVLTIPKGIEN